jgi:hypothetical protein
LSSSAPSGTTAAPVGDFTSSSPVGIAAAAERAPAGPGLSGRKFVETFGRFQARLEDALGPIKARPLYVASRRRKWRNHMPRLARNCADALDLFPGLFSAFSVRGDDLRALEEEVRQTGQFLVFLKGAYRLICAVHMSRKAELCDRTMEVVDQVNALRCMPQLGAESREQADHAASLFSTVVDPANQALRRRRKNNTDLREEGEALTEEVAKAVRVARMENQVLRGGSLTPEAVREAVGTGTPKT